jgi:hypothetical protein
LGIPGVKDRVVQQATKLILEPIFEADFRECSFGFRPRRSAHKALERVRVAVNAGGHWVVDADVRSFLQAFRFLTGRWNSATAADVPGGFARRRPRYLALLLGGQVALEETRSTR